MKNKNEYELALQENKRIKIAIIALIIVAIIIALTFFKGYTSAKEKYEEKYLTKINELEEEVERLSEPVAVYIEASKEVDINIINSEIQDVGELVSIEYLYTDAGKFEDPAKVFGKELPFSLTTKSFIAKWDGVIKAGVDIKKSQWK